MHNLHTDALAKDFPFAEEARQLDQLGEGDLMKMVLETESYLECYNLIGALERKFFRARDESIRRQLAANQDVAKTRFFHLCLDMLAEGGTKSAFHLVFLRVTSVVCEGGIAALKRDVETRLYERISAIERREIFWAWRLKRLRLLRKDLLCKDAQRLLQQKILRLRRLRRTVLRAWVFVMGHPASL